jgi:hypothetical protein
VTTMIGKQVKLDEFRAVIEMFSKEPNIESGELQYQECIGRRDLWDNLGKIETADVQDIILPFLNKWRCRLSDKCASELALALNEVEHLIRPLRSLYVESANMFGTTESSDGEARIIALIEESFGTVQEVVAGRRTVGFTATSKMFHMAIPSFFVMSDEKIREHYGCEANGAGYANFMLRMNLFAKDLVSQAQGNRQTILGYSKWPGRALTRLLDNYNYTMFTLGKQDMFP